MKVDRRQLLVGSAALAATAGCTRESAVGGASAGADLARGHMLAHGGFPAPTVEERTGIVIVGGGVAGLAAGWALTQAGFGDFRLLELEDEPGGNARAGRNAVSPFPLGAHYLPVANEEATALRRMLTQFGMITGERAGLPVYDPYQLCADLDERLLWQGRWQEGLMPRSGLSADDAVQIARFEREMAVWRDTKGADGKPAFAVPTAYSSADPSIRALDTIGFDQWLGERGFTAGPLRAHVRYACRDDYGCEPEAVSAWAGLHYFAGRRGLAADGAGDNQLTWPEGNARLTRRMAADFAPSIATGRVTFAVARNAEGVTVDSYDVARKASTRIRARAAILAVPQFVARRLTPEFAGKKIDYAPWLVANLTVDRLPQGRGAALAWDNVSATSESLGYVVATHQSIETRRPASVLTWYMPLSRATPAEGRRLLLERPAEAWRGQVRDDLLAMHPELDGAIRSIDLWRWGHAMARPVPGHLFGGGGEPTPPLFLAHSDLGLPLFEDAHYFGVRAAEGAMAALGHVHETML